MCWVIIWCERTSNTLKVAREGSVMVLTCAQSVCDELLVDRAVFYPVCLVDFVFCD